MIYLFLLSAPAEAGFAWIAPGCGSRCTYSSTGEDIRVEEVDTGFYRVWFEGHYDNASQTLFASAGYDALDGEVCKLGDVGWSLFGDEFVAEVRCFDAYGAPVSFPFVLAYRGDAPVGTDAAWVRSDKPAEPIYVPDPDFSYNPRGTNTVSRVGPGAYQVELEGMEAQGVALVTAAGESDERCTVEETYKGARGVVIEVLCSNSWGDAADTVFYLSWMRQLTFSSTAPADSVAGAHLWASAPYHTQPYQPYWDYAWNGRSSEASTITRLDTGLYDVEVPGMDSNDAIALVTAYGVEGQSCQPSQWSGTHVTVACFQPGGKPRDSQFVLSFQQPW